MTAYRLTPVGAEGVQKERAEVIDIPSRYELLLQVDALKGRVAAAERLWREEVDHRVDVQARLNRSMRVLASLGRLSPRMAGVVAAAGREIWQLDRADQRRQSRVRREVYGRLP